MRILIGSSSPHRQAFYREAVQGWGHAVRVASGGVECAEALRSELPDLLIVETPLMWGGTDGVLAELQGLAGPGPLPVILVAAAFSAEDWFRLGRFRVDNFLFHVPNAEELHSAITAFVAESARSANVDHYASTG